MQDLGSSQRWLRRIFSSGTRRRAVRLKSTDVLEEHVASNFTVEEWAKEGGSMKQVINHSCTYYLLHVSIALGLFFYPGDGSDMFLRNVDLLSSDYTALYARR
jgi:hypothetical protein